jgi:hypothetical protein
MPDARHTLFTSEEMRMVILAHSRSLLSVTMAVATTLACMVFTPTAMDLHAQETSAAADETQHTQAGVMAVDAHWSVAEMTGDTNWLDQMLLPEYRSVNNDGTVHAKAAILAGAAKRKGTDLAKAKQDFADYQKQHPYGTAVTVQGDTAIITFYDPTLGPQKGVKSSDIFVYLDGHWHAMYSQHTAQRG